MARLEDTLRDAFRDRVAVAPAVPALTDRAIIGAARVRRRRTATACAVAALCVALVGLSASFVGGRGGVVDASPFGIASAARSPTEPVAPAAVPVDVVIDATLYRAGGGRVLLGGLAPCELCRVADAWRVPDGWLVESYRVNEPPAPPQSTLWFVPELGSSTPPLVTGTSMHVSRETGSRPRINVAWTDSERLYLGTYSGQAVTDVVSTPAPEVEVPAVGDLGDTRRLYPQAVVGGAVLLAGTHTGAGLGFWDVWFPDRGDFVPADQPQIEFLGTTTDGERIIAWYYPDPASKIGCLGALDLDGFTPVRSLCPAPFPFTPAGVFPSPDGRWWLVTDPLGARLYDAQRVWDGAEPVHTWSLGGDYATEGTWVDDETVVLLTEEFLLLRTDGRPVETVALPAAASRPARIVVDLR